jgi:hypothetical protein
MQVLDLVRQLQPTLGHPPQLAGGRHHALAQLTQLLLQRQLLQCGGHM